MNDETRHSPLIGQLLLIVFFIGLIVSIAAVRVSAGGLPVRTFLMFAELGLVGLYSPVLLIRTVIELKRLLMIIAAFALVGIISSVVSNTSWSTIVRQLIEINVQAVVSLVVAATLTKIVGPGAVVKAFLFAWGISAAFAIAQVLGVGPAWEVRASLGKIMNDTAITRVAYEHHERALGLSYSPVHLAAQSCLAVAGFYALRLLSTRGEILRRPDIWLLGMLVIAMVVCVASGNRSPLIGFIVFGALYVLKSSRRLFLMILPVAVLGAVSVLVLMPMMERAGVRVAETEDGSAEGRATLRHYGIQLFLDNPLGYGFGFDSTEYASEYANDVIYMDNPAAIKKHALHNYYLATLNKYGILVFALLLLIIPRNRYELYCWMGFLPYMVHAFFHNDGPFQGDFFIWYLFPVFSLALGAIAENEPVRVDNRPWTRNYRARREAASSTA